MQSFSRRLGSLALASFGLASTASTAHAASTEITISMAAPPNAPRLLGAGNIGAVTGTPFLYTIPATGTRPLTFDAVGLPAGLALDPATGRITGAIATAGPTTVTLRATNAAGSDSRDVTITAGTTLALTPPMGWNSYDSFDDSVRETEFTDQAQWLLDHLQPFGWQYVVVDFRWYDPQAPASDQNQAGTNNNLVIDANGRFQPDPVRFPSAAGGMGFGPLATRIHAMGLKFGIHIMRGIPRRAVQGNMPIAGSTSLAPAAANTSDTATWNSDMYGVLGDTAAGQAWYDSIVQQYAAWGVDFIKADDMIRNVAPINYHQSEVDALRRAIDKSGRAIVLSLSPGEMQVANAADLVGNANMWRMSNDFWDRPGDLDRMFMLAGNWQTVSSTGHWPDADMLPLGHLGPRCPVNGLDRNTSFTHNEQVSMISFWSLLPSPLMLGANMPLMDAWTTALLTNEEVLAVGQDALGQRARVLGTQGMQETWVKNLSGGRKAVGFFNHGAADVAMSMTFASLGVSGPQRVRDVWRRADYAVTNGTITANVPFRGAILFVVTPDVPDAGPAVDASSLPSVDASSPVPEAAGAVNDAASSVEAGVAPTPDASAPPPSDAGAQAREASAGNPPPGGDASIGTPSRPSAPAKSGCSCRVGASSGRPSAMWLGIALFWLARRRARVRRA